ncbi:two-partner secretion domain-containing protein [Cardiobacterium hominis]|nr:hemagglutinin repeat-containing protein [Cardiobacterium hominis]
MWAQSVITEDDLAAAHERPTVLKTANGLPQIDIQTPDESGISMNRYSQFDVDSAGAIMNNARKDAATQTGGVVSGNPHLARGEADLIVNQVRSQTASNLQGTIEIAGKKADVIVANPAGIMVNGGFINAGKVHYTAGQVEIKQGKPVQHSSESGVINIASGGLNAQNHDYTTLLARQIKINGAIHGEGSQIDLITGNNTLHADGTIENSSKQADKPVRFAVDSSALGGMYANRIRLIGTEKGVGVHHAGKLQTDALELSLPGTLHNQGEITANQLDIKTTGLKNDGTLHHSSDQTLTIRSNIFANHDGARLQDRQAEQHTEKPQPAENKNEETRKGAAGRIEVAEKIENRGSITTGGKIDLASKDYENHGNVAINLFTLREGKLDNRDGSSTFESADIKASQLDNARGELFLYRAKPIQVKGEVNNHGGQIHGVDSLSISAGKINNTGGGSITSDNSLSLQARGSITNAGSIGANNSVSLQAGKDIANSGQIRSGSDLNLSAGNDITNGGQLFAGNTLNLSAGNDINNSATISGDLLNISANRLNNSETGSITQRGPYTLNIHTADYDTANNPYGTIRTQKPANSAASNTTSTAPGSSTDNEQPSTEGTLKIRSQFNNRGVFEINNMLSVTASNSFTNHQTAEFARLTLTNGATLDNSHGELRSQEMRFDSRDINNSHGTLKTNTLQLNTAKLDNSHGRIDIAKQGNINVTGTWNNKHGTINSNHNLTIRSQQADNSGGSISSNHDLFLYNPGNWNNGSGQLLAGHNMTLNGGSLNNQGRIQAGEQLNYNGFTQLNQGGQLFAGNITLNGKQLNNSGETGSADTLHIQSEETHNSGKISSQNTFTFNSAKTENSGQLLTNSLFTLNTAEFNNRGKISSAGDANINAASVDNSGDIHAKEKLFLRGNTLKNRGTAAAGETDVAAEKLENGGILSGKTRVTVSTPQMGNRGGSIVSDQDVTINTPELDNEQGHIASKGKLTLNVKAGSAINNKHGVLASEEDLELDTARLDNEGGNIHSGKTLHINTPELNNQGGSIDATAHHLQSTAINNENGHLIGRESLTLTSDGEKLNNRGGQIISKGKLDITAKDTTIDSSGGYIVGKNIAADVGSVSGGKIESWEELTLRAKKAEKMESVRSGRNMNIETQDKYSMTGQYYSGGEAVIRATGGLEFAPEGKFAFNENLKVSSDAYIINRGLLSSLGKITVQAPEYIENRDGGRIYGAHVAISTKSFLNTGENSIVKGANRVEIGAETIKNDSGAHIESLGTINIGRELDGNGVAFGQAKELVNMYDAVIDAAGDLNIDSKQVDNFANVQLGTFSSPKENVEFYSSQRTTTEWVPENRRSERELPMSPFKYVYKLADIEERPVAENPSVIKAGGTLTFNSEDIYNEGHIAAGRIGGVGKNAINGGHREGRRYTAAIDGKVHTRLKEFIGYDAGEDYTPPILDERFVRFPIGSINEGGQISGNPNQGGGTGGVPFPGGTGGGSGHESSILDAIDKEGRAVPYRVMTPNLPQLLTQTQGIYQLNLANVDPVPGIPGMPDAASLGLVTHDPAFLRILQNLPEYRDRLPYTGTAITANPNRYGDLSNNAAYGSGATVGTPYTDFSRSIGDRYYNYHLVADMVARNTGYRYLKGYHDDASQFAALTAAGNSFRERYQIAPGVSLTAEQAKHLDQDMILMVDRTFTLPDGRQVTRQVPQLYARIQPDELDTSRPTIGANRIDLSGSGTLNNNGSIGGRDSLSLQYQNITNRGTLTSDHGNVHARDTFDGKGGTINAGKYFSATAGKTFNFQPQTSDIDGSADRAANRSYHSAHQIEDSGRLKRYATGSTVILGGAKETNLKATQLDLGDKSSRTIISGDKVNLGAEYTHDVKMDDQGGSNYHYRYHGEDQGVETTGDGALSVSASAGKLTVNAAKLNSGKNRVQLYGAKGIDVTHGEIIDKEVTSSNHKGGGLFSRSHTRDYESWEAHQVKTSDITGDSVALVADRGDINAVGSNIVGEHGALLQTRQGDITLKAGENTYHSEERHSKRKVGLMGSGGIGVTLGSRSQSSDNTLDLKGHTATVVGAIDGNVTIDAGGHYREQGAIVHAGRAGGPLTKEQWLALSPAERNRAGNVYLNAQSAELDVMRGEQKQEMNSRYKQTGITVNLSGALVNAAQMARKNLQHLGKSDNARVKAMAAANAAWSGYKAVQAVNEAVQSGSGGTLINLSISGGSQHSSSHQRSREDILQSSQLTGDSGVYLNIRGKGAGSTLNITGSDLGGSAVTMLNVEGKKTFQAAETRREIHSDQHSGGGGGGIALQGGSNGGGLGITANANIGKGETNGNSTTYRLSHIGGLSGHTDIGDGKTLLNGAQILGKSIEGNTRDLEIHSPQGTMDYQSRQNALSGNVLYGYGVSVNLDYQNTRVDAHEKTVNIDSGQRDAVRGVQESGNNRIQALTGSIKQNDALANSGQDKTGGVSGFYAGDDGYRIHNTGTTVLGGLITSTAKAEAEGKNHFSTDRLVREEIHNYSNYKGKSIALGVSTVLSGDTLEQGEAQRREFMDVGKSGVGKTFGIGREQRSQEGVTIGSVNTANLTIGDDAGQRLLTGESAAEAAKNANRGITLEHVKEHNGTTSVSFDADKVTRDITSTAQVMQGFDGTTQGIKHDLRKQADAYRERGDEETAAKLDKLTIGVDMLKGGLTPTDSALGTIANTAAPLVSYQIGQYAKAHGSEGSAGHIAAHAALAALTSAANGGSGTDMATSAAITGAAEYSAPLVAKGFYGTSDSSKLTAEQKETISNILGLAAAGAGAAVGNSTTAYGASRAAGNAVDNNYYLTYTALEPKQSIADNKKTYEILKDTVKARCTESAAECEQYTQYIIDFIQDERFKENYAAEQKESLQYLKDNPRIVENYETRKKIKFELEDNSKLHRYVLPSAEMAGGFAQAAASAVAMSACLESGGATCYLGTAGFVSATDHVMTGADNFGARRSQQRQTTMVNTLKGLGLSEGAAANSQLMLDVGSGFATAARGAAIAHARTYSVTPKFLPEYVDGAPSSPNHISPATQLPKTANGTADAELRTVSKTTEDMFLPQNAFISNSLTPLQLIRNQSHNIEHTASIRMDHILDGNLTIRNGIKKGSGGHYIRSHNIKIDEITGKVDVNGVQKGRISVRDPSTNTWVKKSGETTFYPYFWSRRRVQQEIESAFKNSKPHPTKKEVWVGKSDSGLEIEGYYNKPDGTGATAWPIYKGD